MNTEVNLNTLNIDQLAVILDISTETIKSDLDRARWRIPEPVKRGKKSHLIWLEVVVFEWMMERSQRPAFQTNVNVPLKKRGRPKKSPTIHSPVRGKP